MLAFKTKADCCADMYSARLSNTISRWRERNVSGSPSAPISHRTAIQCSFYFYYSEPVIVSKAFCASNNHWQDNVIKNSWSWGSRARAEITKAVVFLTVTVLVFTAIRRLLLKHPSSKSLLHWTLERCVFSQRLRDADQRWKLSLYLKTCALFSSRVCMCVSVKLSKRNQKSTDTLNMHSIRGGGGASNLHMRLMLTGWHKWMHK